MIIIIHYSYVLALLYVDIITIPLILRQVTIFMCAFIFIYMRVVYDFL